MPYYNVKNNNCALISCYQAPYCENNNFYIRFYIVCQTVKKAKRISCLHQYKLPICASLTYMLWLPTVSIHVDSKLILQCDIQMHTFMGFFFHVSYTVYMR